ncbi:MAG TPA: TonB-dependent receptor plug domain-containing protein, partial [Longimicrobiales bacterium]|nr:TonB-dependent receptor plug domain-containing protein [Longimicrobiales bacterium]
MHAQQTGTVTGRVTNSSTNGPVAAAQVSIANLNLGALTRDDGRFIILQVPAGQHQVTVTSIGFASQTQTIDVQAGATTVVDFRVGEQAVALDEIVVTGVGAAARRRSIGNSLAQIDLAATASKPVTNVESLLRGTVAGVSSLSVSGQVGASGTIQLRGVTSVSQGNEPLIYVDGVRLSTNRVPPANLEDGRGARTSGMSLNDINPQDIERIEIIKGAAATTLYGTEASAGVIQVFTKRGSEGAPQWSMSVSGGGNFWPQISDVIKQDPTELDLVNIKRTGAVQGLTGSVRGGSEALQYFISGEYNDAEGIVDTQRSKNWGVTGNFTVRLYEGLTLALNNSYAHRNTRYVPDSNNRHGYVLNVMRVGKGYWPGNRDQSWVLESELRGITDNFITGARVDYVKGSVRNRVQLGLHQLEVENLGLLPWGYYL